MHDHKRWRSALLSRLSPHRISALRPMMQGMFDQLLNGMIASGPRADVVTSLATPFASQAIFELMGIPNESRSRVQGWSDAMRMPKSRADATTNYHKILSYLEQLLVYKRKHPASDALSDLATAIDGEGRLNRSQMIEAAGHLFFGGYETMAARISYGVLFLLHYPDQRNILARTPSLASRAVDEVLRMAVPGGSWLPRYASADIDYNRAKIRKGDLVVFSIQAANRDSSYFRCPHSFDITRPDNRHLAFGHGKFFCLGAGFARLGLEIVIGTLFRRLPNIHLSLLTDEMLTENPKVTGGLSSLPVAW
jgi:cytochrome P450 monooxygenase